MHYITPFFYNFWHNFKTIFSYRNLPWHALAILLTYGLVKSGFDQFFFINTRFTIVFSILIPAALLGFIIPIFGPFVLIGVGKSQGNKRAVNLGYAIGQAGLLGWIVSSLYKVFTGRVHPILFNSGNNLIEDISREFQFGIFRGGIFWGWPSSHTTVAFAIATTILILHPKKRIKLIGLLFALYVGVGVAATGIHWFSDFAAGIIFGTLVGVIVGLSFRNGLIRK